MPNTKTGGNRWVPDIRPENIDTYAETYSGESAEYKIVDAHPIIKGFLNKMAFFRTHAAAVWYNKLANMTVKDKIVQIDNKLSLANRTVYVSPSGSDETGDGTQAKPYRQITYALTNNPAYSLDVTLTIRAAAGTYNAFSVSGRRVVLTIDGNVTIQQTNTAAHCITVARSAIMQITASETGKYSLTLSGGMRGLNISSAGFLYIASSVLEVAGEHLTQYFCYTSEMALFATNSTFTINASCTLTNVFHASVGGYINLYLSSGSGGSIDATVTSTAFFATQCGKLYVKNAEIPNKCTYGLRATEGGQVHYSAITNNAATPMSATSGGRIFGGTQSNIPSY